MSDLPDVGESNPIGMKLKAAREKVGLSLDDVANKTRVPIRHLQHIEAGEWDALPAPTYSVGFARSYANAVGLNGTEIGAQLREQLGGGQRSPAQVYYEPADPARVPPKSLAIVAGAIALLLVVGYMIWRSGTVDDTDVEQAEIAAIVDQPIAETPKAPAAAAAPAAAPGTAAGPVVLTATDEVWLRIYEAGGARLHEGILRAGETYQVPATAQRPQIITGRPQVLRVQVGNLVIPQLAPTERTISDVSLLPADLVARQQQAAAGAGAAPVQQPAAR